MALKLDTNKPYGIIHGDEAAGRKYDQNGHFFTASGEEWKGPPPGYQEDVIYTKADMEAAIAAAIATAEKK